MQKMMSKEEKIEIAEKVMDWVAKNDCPCQEYHCECFKAFVETL